MHGTPECVHLGDSKHSFGREEVTTGERRWGTGIRNFDCDTRK